MKFQNTPTLATGGIDNDNVVVSKAAEFKKLMLKAQFQSVLIPRTTNVGVPKTTASNRALSEFRRILQP